MISVYYAQEVTHLYGPFVTGWLLGSLMQWFVRDFLMVAQNASLVQQLGTRNDNVLKVRITFVCALALHAITIS